MPRPSWQVAPHLAGAAPALLAALRLRLPDMSEADCGEGGGDAKDQIVPDILILYVTCADAEEARRIGHALVAERLAACVNFRPHQTIYRWKGAIEESAEYGLIVKTTAAAQPAAEARIRALHSYDLPGILAFPASGGSAPYLDWIAENSG